MWVLGCLEQQVNIHCLVLFDEWWTLFKESRQKSLRKQDNLWVWFPMLSRLPLWLPAPFVFAERFPGEPPCAIHFEWCDLDPSYHVYYGTIQCTMIGGSIQYTPPTMYTMCTEFSYHVTPPSMCNSIQFWMFAELPRRGCCPAETQRACSAKTENKQRSP